MMLLRGGMGSQQNQQSNAVLAPRGITIWRDGGVPVVGDGVRHTRDLSDSLTRGKLAASKRTQVSSWDAVGVREGVTACVCV